MYKPVQKLLRFDNYKMQKSVKFGYLSVILYLAPYKLSGVNICPKASKGCIAGCLNLSGRGVFDSVKQSRLNKTKYFLQDRVKFLNQLDREIKNYHKRATALNLKLNVRLNGTSDLPFERYKLENGLSLMDNNPTIDFHDYTKIKNRLTDALPKNYQLTFSKSESNDNEIQELIMTTKQNIAVVFNKLPRTYLGRKVIDGDLNDLRFLDPKNSIVGLIAKGKAKKDNSGFVVNI
jgi:hypothetical protein